MATGSCRGRSSFLLCLSFLVCSVFPAPGTAQTARETGAGNVETIIIERRPTAARGTAPKGVAPQPVQGGDDAETIVIKRASPSPAERHAPPGNAPSHERDRGERHPEGEGPPIDPIAGKFDIVLGRGQPPVHGNVIAYSGDLLRFETTDRRPLRITRDDLIMVSFHIGQLGAMPRIPTNPREMDPEKDLVITYDGEVTPAEVSAITEMSVVTDLTTFSRENVNRILFRRETEAVHQAKSDDVIVEPWPPPGDPPTAAELAEGGSPPSGGPRAPGDRVEACPKDKPLGGWLTLAFVRQDNYCCSSEVRLRARFPLEYHPLVPGERATWKTALERGFQAPRMIYRMRMTGVHQRPDTDWDYCTIHRDSAVVRGSAELRVDWDRASLANDGHVDFHPLRPELVIFFPEEVAVPAKKTCTCGKSDGGGSTSTESALSADMGYLFVKPLAPLPGPRGNWVEQTHEIDLSLETVPTMCWHAPRRTVECSDNSDRYAVIPFSGRFIAPAEDDWNALWLPGARVRFGICCGCGGVPSEQTFASEDEETDCFETARLQRDIFDAEFESFEKAWTRTSNDLIANREDTRRHGKYWAETMLLCGMQDLTIDLAVNSLSLLLDRVLPFYGESLPPHPFHAGEGYVAWTPRYGNVKALPPSGSGPFPPGPGPRLSSPYVPNWNALEYFIDGYNLYKQGPEMALLRDKFERCVDSKPFFLERDQWKTKLDRAEKYLDYRERVERLASEKAKLANDLVHIDIERATEMARYHALCVDCAKEQGKDPKLCDSLRRDLQLASP